MYTVQLTKELTVDNWKIIEIAKNMFTFWLHFTYNTFTLNLFCFILFYKPTQWQVAKWLVTNKVNLK